MCLYASVSLFVSVLYFFCWFLLIQVFLPHPSSHPFPAHLSAASVHLIPSHPTCPSTSLLHLMPLSLPLIITTYIPLPLFLELLSVSLNFIVPPSLINLIIVSSLSLIHLLLLSLSFSLSLTSSQFSPSQIPLLSLLYPTLSHLLFHFILSHSHSLSPSLSHVRNGNTNSQKVIKSKKK